MQQHLAHLFPTREGLALAGVILAKRSPNGTFNIRGREKEIHAQLQAAYGKAVTPQAMRYVERGCELLAKVSDQELEQAAYPFHPNPHARTTSGNDFSDLTKGLMMFALTGLNDMENVLEGKARLLKMQGSIHHDSLLKSYGLPIWAQLTKDDGDDEEDDEDDEDEGDDSDDSGTSAGGGNSHYNPDEPRIPAGQPGGGQWTTAGNGVSSDSGSISANDIRTALREDFDNYNPSALPQETQVADNNLVQSDAPSLPNQPSDEWSQAWIGQPHQALREFIAQAEFPDVTDSDSYGYDQINNNSNGNNALGRYQFLESTLVQMGLKDSWASNDCNSDTDFAQKYGIKTDNDFLQNEAAQEAVMTQYLNGIAEDANKLMPDYGNTTFIGIKGQPITVTQSGLIAAIHREGYPAVKTILILMMGETLQVIPCSNLERVMLL